jgi:hypothetical protein
MKSLDFEFQRKTESAVEYIDEHWKFNQCSALGQCDRFNVAFGLLCNPKGIKRTFRYDCWSQLNGNHLERGKDGNYHRGYYNNPQKDYHEAWVKPNNFIGIIIHIDYTNWNTPYDQGVANLPAATKRMLKAASTKYHVPIYQWKEGQKDLYKLKEIKL